MIPKNHRFIFLVIISIVSVMFLAADARSAALVSVNTQGSQGGFANGYAFFAIDRVAVSGDGRYVAFATMSAFAAKDNQPNTIDIYVKDMSTGALIMASTDSLGNPFILPYTMGPNGTWANGNISPSISKDGRYIAFASARDGVYSVCIKDILTGQLKTISNAGAASLSATGRYVAYSSNMSPNCYQGYCLQVFLDDLVMGTHTMVSVRANGSLAGGGWTGSHNPSVAEDGYSVAFVSDATNLFTGDTNNADDVFLKRGGADPLLVSNGINPPNWPWPPSQTARGASSAPSVTADGLFVAFSSDANNLVPNDNNNASDIFVKDTLSGAISRVSTDVAGNEAIGDYNRRGSYTPSISGDGRYVTFTSYAPNLVASDSNDASDVFVKDRLSGAIERVSVDSSGNQGCSWCASDGATISYDGRFMAFGSAAKLSNQDSNNTSDAYLAANPLAATKPDLSLSLNSPYWRSYADYQTRILSVDYKIRNNSVAIAHSVIIQGASATDGASLDSVVPISMGDIASGSYSQVTIDYRVPSGINRFTTNLQATALDDTGVSYSYP